MSYRPALATSSDVQLAQNLIDACLPDQDERWIEWVELATHGTPEPTMVLAYADEEVVGVAGFAPTLWMNPETRWHGRWWELSPLVVHPEHRGQGLTNVLLAAGAELAMSVGIIGIWAGVESEQRRLIEHYLEHGFHELEPGQTLLMISGEDGTQPIRMNAQGDDTPVFASVAELLAMAGGYVSSAALPYRVEQVDAEEPPVLREDGAAAPPAGRAPAKPAP